MMINSGNDDDDNNNNNNDNSSDSSLIILNTHINHNINNTTNKLSVDSNNNYH